MSTPNFEGGEKHYSTIFMVNREPEIFGYTANDDHITYQKICILMPLMSPYFIKFNLKHHSLSKRSGTKHILMFTRNFLHFLHIPIAKTVYQFSSYKIESVRGNSKKSSRSVKNKFLHLQSCREIFFTGFGIKG